MRSRVAVVGCGPAGAAAALFLARQGREVEVFERAPKLEPIGAGVLIQPTGLFVAERLGLRDRLLDLGAKVRTLSGRTRSGRLVLELNYRYFAPDGFSLGVHRGTLFRVLQDALLAEGVLIRAGGEIARVRQLDGRAVLLEDVAGRRFGPYDLVIAADGAHSRLRDASPYCWLSKPHPWGALWTTAPDPDGAFSRGEALIQVYEGTRRMLGVKPSGRLPDGKTPLVTIFWSIRLDQIPAWREAGLDAWKKEAAALAPFAAPLLERIDNADAIVPSSYHNVWMSRWTEGRAAYIGDAAHATSPQLGQGVNLGLWDAMVLAQCLQDAPDIPAGLARYHGRRRRNVRFYQLAAGFLTPFFQSDFDFLAWPRDLALGTLCRLPWTRTEGARVAAGVKTGLFSSMALEDR